MSCSSSICISVQNNIISNILKAKSIVVFTSLVDIGINSTLLKLRIAAYSDLNILPTECRHMIQSNHR